MKISFAPRKNRTAYFDAVSKSTQYDGSQCRAFYTKWYGLYKNSLRRGVAMRLPFASYLVLAERAGLKSADSIGRTLGKYQVGRFGDKGSYSPTNCRFITAEQNRNETLANGGYARGGSKQRGRNKTTHANLARLSKLYEKPFRATAPSGKVYAGKNLTEFCRKRGFNRGAVCACARGDKAAYKGWSFTYTKENDNENSDSRTHRAAN